MKTTLEILQERFGGPLIRITDVGAMLGMSPRTISNRITLEKFFIPRNKILKIGKYNFIDIRDLAEYLDNAKNDAKYQI